MVSQINKRIDTLTQQLSVLANDTESTHNNSGGSPISTINLPPKPIITLASKLSNAIDFFGDSITKGFRVQQTERWSALVCNNLSKTENNYGVDGAQWLDATKPIYDSHTKGNSTFFAYGVNDVARGQRYFDEMKRIIYSLIMYSTLPSQNIVNARAATLSTSGWVNTGAFNTVGVMTEPVNNGGFPNTPSITATVTGRYIGFASTVVNSANVNDNWSMQISVDNNLIGVNPQPFFNIQENSNLGSSFGPFLWIYDVGEQSTGQQHTIQLTPMVNGNYGDRAFCDYFFGFDPKVANATSVVLLEPTDFDYSLYNTQQAEQKDALAAMTAYKSMLRSVVTDFNHHYGLPVSLVSSTLPYDMGYTSYDLVHPLQPGHKAIAKQILNTLATSAE